VVAFPMLWWEPRPWWGVQRLEELQGAPPGVQPLAVQRPGAQHPGAQLVGLPPGALQPGAPQLGAPQPGAPTLAAQLPELQLRMEVSMDCLGLGHVFIVLLPSKNRLSQADCPIQEPPMWGVPNSSETSSRHGPVLKAVRYAHIDIQASESAQSRHFIMSHGYLS
jgi:hypothetical protein